ncbi:GNAT family N-acetyltransferase [Psychroflexus salis]|uniref:N-acetyltransferase n=1 Tax=Psychroflexus salis TaxID=1526574 RepID=A0A917E724_9FLAO|nr:GNAT family N-acetyltransferase [Psychroflexus salis]GGE11133.1 N-acetyltransferase [Psychroflexus salis]
MFIRQVSVTDIIPIRHQVLRQGKAIESSYFTGDTSKNTFHLGVFLNHELAGICSLVNQEKTINAKLYTYQLRGMAVLDKFQGKKVGTSLMHFIPDFLKSKSNSNLWCNARTSAVLFYEKFNFVKQGDVFEIPDVGPHQLMHITYE